MLRAARIGWRGLRCRRVYLPASLRTAFEVR
jgi:hypothetical protein